MSKINFTLGAGSIQLPADMVVQAALKHACGIDSGHADHVSAPAPVESIPALGEYWPGEGGFNGGLFQGGERPYYLIVADADIAAEFGGYLRETKGADSPWDGAKNTRDLLACFEDHPAADVAAKHQADGHSDFYLPARRELQVLETNVSQLFKENEHWSSTQYSVNYAFSMDFEGGRQLLLWMNFELLVRPVRRKFITQRIK